MATEKTIRIKIDSNGAKKDVDSLDRSMKGLGSTADNTDKSFGALKTTVIAVAAALQVRQIAAYSDAFTSIQNQIRQTTTTTEQLTKKTADLLNVANRSRVEFSATAELYTNLALSTENLNLSTEEQLRLTETIAKSFSVSGKSAAESAGAIRQLGQAFASGALRGDEFNSIAEGAPEIMRALQRSLNLTQGELRDFAATGGITAEILVTALGGAAEVIDGKMGKAVKTLGQSMQEAENNAIAFVGASDSITSATSLAGESIVALSENLDVIANVLLVASIAGFGKLSAGIILNTVETVKNTVAKSAGAKTTSVFSAATLTQTAVVTRSTVAMRAATIASTTLNRAMGILGGPLGIILTVASGLLIFSANAETAKEKSARLSSEINTLSGSFSSLNSAQLDVAIKNTASQVFKLSMETEKARKEVERMVKSGEAFSEKGFMTYGFKNASENLRVLTEQLNAANIASAAALKEGENRIISGGTDQSGMTAPTSTGGKEKEAFVNTEQSKTDSLRIQLMERQEMQKAYNAFMIGGFNSLAEQEQAINEFNRTADLIALDAERAQSIVSFEEKREQLLSNTKLDHEAMTMLKEELRQQELIQMQIFEVDKINIEKDAADKRAEIARQESQDKINNAVGFTQNALSLEAAFASKSEKSQKKRRKVQVLIDTAAGIQRAYAEHDFYTATGISLGIAASGKQQLDAISSGGQSSGGVDVSAAQESQAAPRQEPIERVNVIENRGLSEVANALANLDPDEVLPVEYTQRIVASLANIDRMGGG